MKIIIKCSKKLIATKNIGIRAQINVDIAEYPLYNFSYYVLSIT